MKSKILFSVLVFFGCINTVFAGQTIVKIAHKPLSINYNYQIEYKRDSIVKDTSAKASLKKTKREKTNAHKVGLLSYAMLWTSYSGFIIALLISSSAIAFLANVFVTLAVIIGVVGFFTGLFSLLMYFVEKNKKGLAFPIMSILMTLFPIAGILWIINQIGKNGGE